MRSIKTSLSFICAALCCVFLVGSIIAAVLLRPSTSSSDTPSAFSLEPVPHRQATATPPTEEPKAKPPECSLSEREDDGAAFIARAKGWTPECRMRALKEACTPHCLFGDAHAALVEAAKDKAEKRLLLDVVVTNNADAHKLARVLLGDLQRFAVHASAVVPHGSSTPLGPGCHARFRNDLKALDAFGARIGSGFGTPAFQSIAHGMRWCVNCSDSPSHEGGCKSMREGLKEAAKELRDADKKLNDMRAKKWTLR